MDYLFRTEWQAGLWIDITDIVVIDSQQSHVYDSCSFHMPTQLDCVASKEIAACDYSELDVRGADEIGKRDVVS